MSRAGLLQPENAIVMIRGTSKSLLLTVTDEDSNPVNLTNATIYFSVKRELDCDAPCIYKSTLVPSEIEIMDALAGTAKIKLLPADTANMVASDYYYDVWIVLSTGARYAIIKPSIFTIQAGVTVLTI
jgi:hypothetical protein